MPALAYLALRDDAGTCYVIAIDDFAKPGRPLPPRRELRDHSCEFEWGYRGSGPAQLALALLADHLGDDAQAVALYEAFMAEVVAAIAANAWSLSADDITRYVRQLAATTEKGLTMAEETPVAPIPWQYRPLEHDAWGTIRAADGAIVAQARSGGWGYVDEDAHRAAGTDPYEAVARLIISAVNSRGVAAIAVSTLRPLPLAANDCEPGTAAAAVTAGKQLIQWQDAAIGALKLALADFYTPEEAELWLASRHELLGGATPCEAIGAGRGDEVLRLIEQLREVTY